MGVNELGRYRRRRASGCGLNRLLLGMVVVWSGSFASTAAWGWNESGHRIIAAAAAGHMEGEVLGELVRLLKAHPRYRSDLKRYQPKRLGGLTGEQWLLGQAAQWPDRARRFNNEPFYKRDRLIETYHRGRWHYINLPAYLRTDDAKLGIKDPTVDLNVDQPGNVLEALVFIERALGAVNTSDADKGLWISWALHLIADVHQPLHTSAMFTRKRWPNGDRGGNEVKLIGTGKRNRPDSLHYFWDSAISNVRATADIRRLAVELEKQALPAAGPDDADPLRWIFEGQEVAQQEVYGPLRPQLLQSASLRLPDGYASQAHAVSLLRGALAARRTAIWLTRALESRR